MPQFIRQQPVEPREVLSLEQKVNRRRYRPRPRELSGQSFSGDGQIRAVALAIMAALGMRDEPELVDPIPGFFGHSWLPVAVRGDLPIDHHREVSATA